jgi:hypothetical protein
MRGRFLGPVPHSLLLRRDRLTVPAYPKERKDGPHEIPLGFLIYIPKVGSPKRQRTGLHPEPIKSSRLHGQDFIGERIEPVDKLAEFYFVAVGGQFVFGFDLLPDCFELDGKPQQLGIGMVWTEGCKCRNDKRRQCSSASYESTP